MIVAPEELLLLKIGETLDGVDFVSAAEIADLPPVTVRQARNRTPPAHNRPSISIEWSGSDTDRNEQYRNAWEAAYQLDLTLKIDMDLDPEDSDIDPTGWGKMTAIAIACLRAILAPDAPIAPWIDEVIIGDRNPDHDASTPDNGRLEQNVSVVYRVLTTDPGTLLARGENGG